MRGTSVKRTTLRLYVIPITATLAAALALAGCGGQGDDSSGGSSTGSTQNLSGSVKIDGSSTVEPLSSAAAELFNEDQPDVHVTVAASGTGGGFEAFCAGKTDISDASRPIEGSEAAICKKAGIDYTSLHIATDALTVVTNPDVGVDCLTTEQLKKIWEPAAQDKITNWNQVDPSFPDLQLKLFGPGTDSGTFDYFTDVINGEEDSSRTDYQATEDDNVTVQGVSGTDGAMGYFGYSYYEENTDKLTALSIDSGNGCVAPSKETAQDGAYSPLSRPLFMYVADKAYADSPAVKGYVDFYIDQLPMISEAAKFIPLNDKQYAETQNVLASMSQ
jgi:phosphate transport system substrate-binding protein